MSKENVKEFTVWFVNISVMFFTPVIGLFGALILVAIADHATGVMAAKKEKKKLDFFYGMFSSLTKALLYIIIVTAVYSIDRSLLNEITKLIVNKFFSFSPEYLVTKIVALALFSYEFKSVNRNFKKAKGFSIFSALFSNLNNARKLMDDVVKYKRGIVDELKE